MGIVFNYLALKPALLKKAQGDKDVAEALIHHEDGTPEPKGVLNRIQVDKAWDGIAYLLSAERRATDDLYLPADPLAQAVVGREEMLGYGWFEEGKEPLILKPTDVRKIAAALKPVQQKHLRANYDVEAMRAADVYTAGADVKYLLGYFASLKAFYVQAAQAGAAVVIYTS
ncbi:MAG: YfbM family protein [Planctomycetes bacterium]|nr:YfbM family protein [Planctomycetota bacterium]